MDAENNVIQPAVALLTECVDRNQTNIRYGDRELESHSLRSAWIEIKSCPNGQQAESVALLTECVDRNRYKIWYAVQV